MTSRALEQHEATANVISNLLAMCQAVVASNNEKQEALTAIERRSAAQEETFRELTKTVLDLSRREEGYAKAHEEEVQILKTTMTEFSHREEDGAKAAEVEEQVRMVRARDEGITWLRGEVETYQRISQTLASANRVLNEELAEKDAHLQALREAVQTIDLECDKGSRSPGAGNCSTSFAVREGRCENFWADRPLTSRRVVPRCWSTDARSSGTRTLHPCSKKFTRGWQVCGWRCLSQVRISRDGIARYPGKTCPTDA